MSAESPTPNEASGEAPHPLWQFIQQSAEQIAAEYRRIAADALEDPGTAGDEGEENWADLLREWLPHGYHVRTKGRILSEVGGPSPQVDVLVLSPAYPPRLLNRKRYLAGGVVAAFECKLTLRRKHIAAAVKNAALIRRTLYTRTGSPYRELFSPLIYGLLAHSHEWQTPTSKPLENVDRALTQADAEIVQHPREMLDVFCVADLASWTVWKVLPALDFPMALPPQLAGIERTITTAYVAPTGDPDQRPTAIGSFFLSLLRRMAREDPGLRPMAEYLKWTPAWVAGSARPLPDGGRSSKSCQVGLLAS